MALAGGTSNGNSKGRPDHNMEKAAAHRATRVIEVSSPKLTILVMVMATVESHHGHHNHSCAVAYCRHNKWPDSHPAIQLTRQSLWRIRDTIDTDDPKSQKDCNQQCRILSPAAAGKGKRHVHNSFYPTLNYLLYLYVKFTNSRF